MNEFQVASASVCGKDHLNAGRNNQDAVCVVDDGSSIVAVVCDGCGSSERSEIGAQIISRIVAQDAGVYLSYNFNVDCAMDEVRLNALRSVKTIVKNMRGDEIHLLDDNFLCTTVVAVVMPGNSYVFSIGDGFFGVNGEMSEIGPFPGNAPPYMVYSHIFPEEDGKYQFVQRACIPTDALQSLVISTDGLSYFEPDKNVPGQQKQFGSLSQIWTEDKYFNNQDMLRRRFHLIARDYNGEPGFMHDDVGLVVIRRKPEEETDG